MKPIYAALALAATLLTGCGAAMATDIGPAPASSPDYLKPTGAAVPEYLHCQPDECDPDEGETIDAAELAELAAPVVPQSVPTAKEEDEPGWECYKDGNRICGPATEGLAVEAWERFTPSTFPAATLAQAFKVTYHGTAPAGVDLPPSEFHTLASSKTGIDHVFSVEVGATK
jgi:hypothetical protein